MGASVPRLADPADVLAWNTDKRYLLDLGAAGVPVVPTWYVAPGDALDWPDHALVVKPAVGAGVVDTARFTPGERPLAERLLARLHAQGRAAIVQPYLDAVEAEGETAVLFIGGRHSHTMRKAASWTVRSRSPTSSTGPRPCP